MGMRCQLENYTKIPYCACEKCKCGVRDKNVKMIDEEKTHQFFIGLNNDTFSTIHSQVLVLDPLPPLDTGPI